MTWVLANLDVLGSRTLAHLGIAVPAIVLSVLLAMPLGWLAERYGWLRAPLLTGSGLLYAIPSLPLFVVLPLILGTGVRDPINIIVALTLYGLALMVPAVAEALRTLDARVLDSADALGYSAAHRFLAVDLPLAGPALLAGIRVMSVSTISLVTVGAVLGVPSLGLLFTDGFQRGIVAEIVAGIVLTVGLALGIDRLLTLAGRALLPWTRKAPAALEEQPLSPVPVGVAA